MHFFDNTSENLKSNWQERSTSEQRIIVIVGMLAVICLGYFFIIEPVMDYRDKQHRLLSQKTKVYTQAVPLVSRIKSRTSVVAGEEDAGGLAKIMDDSLQQYNLSMRGFQPGRNGDARLRLRDVDYKSTIQWLYDIEYNRNIVIDELSISSSQDTNLLLVNVRVKK
ncbi:type II secretion system protein GspM [Eionea flava]